MSQDPARFVPIAHRLRGGLSRPHTETCSKCRTTKVFQATFDYAKDLKGAGWTWDLQGGAEKYYCPSCSS